MTANQLQELAEKIAAELYTSYGYRQEATDKILPILTESVGTLLQAERAALCEIFVGHRYVTRNTESEPLCSCGYERPEGCWDDCDCYYDHIRTLSDASALSAVVQRETAKLREWKESASNILNQLDLQAIGKEIGLHLGQEVSPNVLPAIKKLKALLRRCYDTGNLPDKLETDIRAALK